MFRTLSSMYYNLSREKWGGMSTRHFLGAPPSLLLGNTSTAPLSLRSSWDWCRWPMLILLLFYLQLPTWKWVCVVRSLWESWWISTWSSNMINSVWAAWSSCRNNFHLGKAEGKLLGPGEEFKCRENASFQLFICISSQKGLRTPTLSWRGGTIRKRNCFGRGRM